MDGLAKYDAIIVLGGGRDNQGNLTELSIQRLDKELELYRQGEAGKIFALGDHLSVPAPKAIYFEKSGARLRGAYLAKKGILIENIVFIHKGRDTIEEAFVSRKKCRELGLEKILLVTSDKHMKRALWVFRRIFGDNFEIKERSVFCGNLLNEDEEKEHLKNVKEFFKRFPENIPAPSSESFYNNFQELFEKYDKIHGKYFPPSGPECQAYMGIKK